MHRIPFRLVLAAAFGAAAASAASAAFTLVSVARDDGFADGFSYDVTISDNGKVVAFESRATDLVDGDTNGRDDLFVRDLRARRTARVNVSSDGTQGDGDIDLTAISGNGRWVVFDSRASNVVANDANDASDVFVHDRKTGETRLVSARPDGLPGSGTSYGPTVSANGRWILYATDAEDIVEGDSNQRYDIVLHDAKTGESRIVSAMPDGTPLDHHSNSSTLSRTGRWAVFYTSSTMLPDGAGAYRVDLRTGEVVKVSKRQDGGDAGQVTLFQISQDGNFVSFWSSAANVVPGIGGGVFRTYLRDVAAEETIHASALADGGAPSVAAFPTSLSANGRKLAFYSTAAGIVPGDDNGVNDVFVFDVRSRTTTRVSEPAPGVDAEAPSYWAALTPNGKTIAFSVVSGAFVEGDDNGTDDVVVTRLR